MALDLRQHLDDRRQLVDRHLQRLMGELDGSPAPLRAAVEYSLLAPGKRMRPLLVILAAEACGGSGQDALPAACAVEMVHAYSLIHDDLPAMDDDDLRRGQATSHKKFGEALAILAGDALLTQAFQVLTNHYPAAIAGACCWELAQHAGALGMVGGQVDDLAWSGKISGPKVSESVDGLVSIHERKTGALFRASLRLGQLTAQGENSEPGARASLDDYGRCFGLAFQITDDLLDVEGQAAVAGKAVGKDADRGKLTFPGLLGRDESRNRARQAVHEGVKALTPFGEKGETLAALLQTVLDRHR